MPNERGERGAKEGEVDIIMEPLCSPIRSVPQGGMSDPEERCAVSACEAKSRGCLTPKCDEERRGRSFFTSKDDR